MEGTTSNYHCYVDAPACIKRYPFHSVPQHCGIVLLWPRAMLIFAFWENKTRCPQSSRRVFPLHANRAHRYARFQRVLKPLRTIAGEIWTVIRTCNEKSSSCRPQQNRKLQALSSELADTLLLKNYTLWKFIIYIIKSHSLERVKS